MKELFRQYLIDLYHDVPQEVYEGLLSVFCLGAVVIIAFKGFRKGWRYVAGLLLTEYIALLYSSMVIFRPYSEDVGYDFTPFWSYAAIQEGRIELIPEIVMNAVVFIPVGILLGSLLRVKGAWLTALAVGMGISISIEALQYVFHRGFAETDDVMHNTAGCLIGAMMTKWLRWIKDCKMCGRKCHYVVTLFFLLFFVVTNSSAKQIETREKSEHCYSEIIKQPSFFNRIRVLFTGSVTPKMFGAKGDGKTDDTSPIQYAINYAAKHNIKCVFIPKGTYLINVSGHTRDGGPLVIDEEIHFVDNIGVGLFLRSNVDILLDEEAVLEALATNQEEYAVLMVREKEDINICGGKIIGDYKNHYGDKGEHGMCVWIQSSSNISVKKCEISQGWGDCVYVGCKWNDTIPLGSNRSKNINISDCFLHDSRRQGISVVGCENLFVKKTRIINIAGCLPQSGIDLEVNYDEYPNLNCVIEEVSISDCKGGGIIGYSKPTHKVEINNSDIQSVNLSCVDGIVLRNSSIDYATFDNYYGAVNDTIIITGCKVKNITLYSSNPYCVKMEDSELGKDTIQPAIAFIKRNQHSDKDEVADVFFENCRILSPYDVNAFSYSSTQPRVLSLRNCFCSLYRRNSLNAQTVILENSTLSGRSVTLDFHSPYVFFENNTIETDGCLENMYGYLFKFETEKRIKMSNNRVIGGAKESELVVVPELYAPECIFSENEARQYKTIGTFGKGAKLLMNANIMAGD